MLKTAGATLALPEPASHSTTATAVTPTFARFLDTPATKESRIPLWSMVAEPVVAIFSANAALNASVSAFFEARISPGLVQNRPTYRVKHPKFYQGRANNLRKIGK